MKSRIDGHPDIPPCNFFDDSHMVKPKSAKPEDIETEPGAEERFERTVRRMLNTQPKPHKPTQNAGDSKVASKPRRKKVHVAR